MTFEIQVTQADIDHARPYRPRDTSGSPIAYAIGRTIPDAIAVVYPRKIWVYIHRLPDYRVYGFKLPDEARNFLEDFQQNRPIKPFTFSLNLTDL